MALIGLLAERCPTDRRAWLGDVGYLLPTSNVDEDGWLASLEHERWRGMHPDLIPFAQDGFGNRFCFVRSERDAMRGVRAIAYWMYETYRAVPVASSFDAFLGWNALTAHLAARRGDAVIDEEHVQGDLLPLLAEVGAEVDLDAALDVSDPDVVGVHRAILNLDPQAPGAQVGLAAWMAKHDRPLEALDLCADACFSFPEFAGARALSARILRDEHDLERLGDALVQTLQRPLAYAGDEAMPFLRDLRPVDLDAVVETLASQEDVPELIADIALANFVLREDPSLPQSWTILALDYAREDALEKAVTAANNALYLGLTSPLCVEIHGLLEELYDALGWAWHARMVRRWGPSAGD